MRITCTLYLQFYKDYLLTNFTILSFIRAIFSDLDYFFTSFLPDTILTLEPCLRDDFKTALFAFPLPATDFVLTANPFAHGVIFRTGDHFYLITLIFSIRLADIICLKYPILKGKIN